MTHEYARLSRLNISPEYFNYLVSSRLEDNLTLMYRAAQHSFAVAPDMPFGCMLDSVAGCGVEEEQTTDGHTARAIHARLLSRELRANIVPTMMTEVVDANDRNVVSVLGRPMLYIFINQLKATMATSPAMPQFDSFGGRALKYHSRVRIMIDKHGDNMDDANDDAPWGIRCRVKIIKNKVAPPLRQIYFDFNFETGIEDYIPAVLFLEKHGALTKSGSRYPWKGKTYFMADLRQRLIDQRSEWEDMQRLVLDTMAVVWSSRRFVPLGRRDIAPLTVAPRLHVAPSRLQLASSKSKLQLA